MEVWLPVPGYEGCYEVSSLGRVKSLRRQVAHPTGGLCWRRERILKPGTCHGGYLMVSLCSKGSCIASPVAHLVATAFLGPRPQGMEVCHCNGVRTDNRVENIRYGTPAGNHADKLAHGTDNRGNKHPLAKLTEANVLEIRALRGVETQANIAKRFGVSGVLVSRVQRREAWKHL